MKYIIPVLCLFLAGQAYAAADAWQSCDKGFEGATDLGSPTMSSGGFIGGRKQVCYDTNGTADSQLLKATRCDNIDIKLYNMTDGDPATNVSVIPRACPDLVDQDPDTAGNQATDTTNCEPIVADLATATNNEALGYKPGAVFIDVVTNTDSDALRVEVWCSGL